jgi:hypothetical protein
VPLNWHLQPKCIGKLGEEAQKYCISSLLELSVVLPAVILKSK